MPLSSVLGAQSLVRPGVCTSSTRPASPFDGQVIYETDTDLVRSFDGTNWNIVGPTPLDSFGALIPSSYYGVEQTSTGTTGTNLGDQVTFYSPIYLSQTTTFDRIACRTASNFSGTATVRLGVYNNENGKPSTVFFDAGTVSCTAASTIYEITINQTIPAGWFWLAFCTQGAATTNTFFSYSSRIVISSPGIARYDSTFVKRFWSESGISGSFATAGSLSNSASVIGVFLRVS